MVYTILQIRDVEENISKQGWAFMGYEFAKEHNFSMDDYRVVYSGKIEGEKPMEVLEDLFYVFNMKHPKDFKGHSLSVSDIVILDGENYYCDRAGWRKM